MFRVLTALAATLAFFQSQAKCGETFFGFVGTTIEESRDVQAPLNLLIWDHNGGKKALQELIDRKPGHELANALFAKVLLEEGDAKSAWTYVAPFVDRDSATSHTLDVGIEIAKALGEEKQVLEFLNRLQNIRMRASPLKGLGEDWIVAAQIAEYSGNSAEATRILTPRLDDIPQTAVLKQSRLGRFCMRNGEYQKALDVFVLAIDDSKRVMPSCEPLWRLEKAKAMWALGMDHDALSETVAAAGQLVINKEGNSSNFIDAMCVIAVLSHSDKVHDDRLMGETALLMKSARAEVKLDAPLTKRVASALCREETREVSVAIEKILKTSPNWNEGLWCALYVGLADSDSRVRLHALLPAGSEQRKMLLAISQWQR